MKKPLTPSDAKRLYKQLGSYQAVAAKTGWSYETVRRRCQGLDTDSVKQKLQQIEASYAEDGEFVCEEDEDIVDTRKMTTEKQIKLLEELYLSFLSENLRRPTMTEMARSGIARSVINHRFGNIHGLHEYMEANHADEFSKHVVTSGVLFTKERMEKVSKIVGDKKRFVITTAVAGKTPAVDFLTAIDVYCDVNDAVLLVLPCADVWSRRRHGGMEEWLEFDPMFTNRHVVSRPLELNNSISILDIKVSAKQIQPLTGISRIGQRNNSIIMASPKQQLDYTATSNDKKLPHAVMSTGACTLAEYNRDRYMSERLSSIAENDHVIGAIIVEIEDERFYHFRQIQASEDGSFTDLCKTYHPDGNITTNSARLILGDYHAGAHDPEVKEGIENLVTTLPIDEIFLHDFFDGFSINHHDANDPGKMARKHRLGLASLRKELETCAAELNFILELFDGKVIVVKSNHDEFLDRYINSGRWATHDPMNSDIARVLAVAQSQDEDLVKAGLELVGFDDRDERVIWLRRDESYKVANVELGAHGDLGPNGSKGGLAGIEKAYGNCVVGHAHTAAILRGVYRVGTSSKMNLDYNRGPSSWTHTSCLMYPNGSRQLINFIGPRWKLETKRRKNR